MPPGSVAACRAHAACCACVGGRRWWPGALGRTATHAVVYASLLLPRADGTTKDMGIHAFMLQIRSLEDHTDMPGLMIGTIGERRSTPGHTHASTVGKQCHCDTIVQGPSLAPTASTTGGCA